MLAANIDTIPTAGEPYYRVYIEWIILDENGELYLSTPGRCLIPQPDGTVQFSVEIASETVVPEQDSYQLSLWLTTEDLDLDGKPIEGTRRSQDWIVTLTPEKPE